MIRSSFRLMKGLSSSVNGSVPPTPPGGQVHISAQDITDESAQTLHNRTGNADPTLGSTGGSDTNDPTLVNAPRISFDGTDDYLDTGHTPTFDLDSGGFSAVGHMSFDTWSGNPRIFSSEGGHGVLMYVSTSGVLQLRVTDGTTLTTAVTAQGGYDDGVPFLFAVSYDGSTRELLLLTSRGDIQRETVAAATYVPINHAELRLACYASSVTQTLECDFYEFASYDTALTEQEAADFVSPSVGWSVSSLNAALGIFPASSLFENGQSIANSQGGDPAVLGSVRGAEITSEGLYLPGVPGNDSDPVDILGHTPDTLFAAAHVQLSDYSTGSNQGVFSDWASSSNFRMLLLGNGSIYCSVLTPSGNLNHQASSSPFVDGEPYWLAITYTDATGLSSFYAPGGVPFSEAVWISTGSTGAGSGVLAFTLNRPDVGQYGGLGITGVLSEALLGSSFDSPRAFASPDFAAQAPGTQSFDDAQGNTWTVNTTGVDTNDPRVDLYEGTKYLQFNNTNANYVESSGGSTVSMEDADVTRFTLLRLNVDESLTGSENILLYAPSGNRFYPVLYSTGTVGIQLTRTAGSNLVSRSVNGLGLRHKPGLRWTVAWDGAGEGIPTLLVEYSDTAINPVWVEAGSSSFVDVCNRPGDSVRSFLGHTSVVPLQSGVYSAVIENDGVPVLSWNPQRDHVSGDTWIDADSGRTMELFPAGTAAEKVRLVTENALVFDGVDDFLQLPADQTPSVQKDSGGYSVWLDVSLKTTALSGKRIFSSENGSVDGVLIYLNSTGIVSLRLSAGGAATTLNLADQDYGDGERIQILLVIDGDNQIMNALTSRDTSVFSSLNQAMGVVTHNPPRLNTRGYSTQSPAGFVLYDVNTWDYALSTAEMEAQFS